MAYRVEVLPQAARDLRLIARRIAVEDSDHAKEWYAGLTGAILSLDEHPLRGGVVRERVGYRKLLYGTKPHVYRIFYRVDGDVVSVAHVRHGARDGIGPD